MGFPDERRTPNLLSSSVHRLVSLFSSFSSLYLDHLSHFLNLISYYLESLLLLGSSFRLFIVYDSILAELFDVGIYMDAIFDISTYSSWEGRRSVAVILIMVNVNCPGNGNKSYIVACRCGSGKSSSRTCE